MRCTVCLMPIYPNMARLEDDARGVMHAECAAEAIVARLRAVAAQEGPADQGRRPEAEKSDRSEADGLQEITTYASFLYPGLYVAVLGSKVGMKRRMDGVNEMLNDHAALHDMTMPERLVRVVETASEIMGTDDVAGRYVNAPSPAFRGSAMICRHGVFRHDHALWAEFLRMVG